MICIKGENDVYIWRNMCAPTSICMIVHVCVCVCVYFIVNLGKAVLGKIMMYFIPDKEY